MRVFCCVSQTTSVRACVVVAVTTRGMIDGLAFCDRSFGGTCRWSSCVCAQFSDLRLCLVARTVFLEPYSWLRSSRRLNFADERDTLREILVVEVMRVPARLAPLRL